VTPDFAGYGSNWTVTAQGKTYDRKIKTYDRKIKNG
jgi:hypothetical protein